MSEAKKRTIKEDIRMVMRGIKILSKEFGSGIFISAILKQVVQSTRNLPNIYLSALVINEIAGECRQKEVIKLAIITVLVNAAVQFVKSLLDRWNNYYIEFMWASSRNIYSKKMFEMDYVDADNVKNHELFAQIMQNNNFGTYGLIRVYTILPSLLGGIAQIAGSAALTVSLFTAKIETNTAMSFLNSPIAVLVVLALMLISVIMPPYLYNKTEKVKFNINKRMVEWDKTLAFYGLKMPYEKERAKDVRLYKQEFSIQKMAEYSISELFKEYTRTTYLKSIVLGQIIKLVYTVFIYTFVATKSLYGAFGIGNIAMYIGAIMQFATGLTMVTTMFTRLKANNDYLDLTYQFLDIPNKMYQGTLSTEKRSDCKYDVEFRNVSFKYPDAENYALRDINISFNAGERVAVVGMNGSGKTTFIKLLCRLYDPTDGEVIMNDFNVRKFDYKQYLDIFSVVFQDFKLLPFTLGENVAASMTYDRAKAEQCLRFVGFGDRLDEMEKGLDTFLYKDFDSSGVEISGGEAQKIALARALYKDAPFIILDEPTAALDPLAEYEIYTKFNEIAGTKTAIYISHRLSSCRFCERILVFDEGRIVEEGSHDELLSRKGKYHELWHAQAQYYDN